MLSIRGNDFIACDFQKSRVTGPWDQKDSVSAKKVKKKISCLCTFNHIPPKNATVCVPRMSALFFHRPPIYERATDHKYTKGFSHLGKKCGGTK